MKNFVLGIAALAFVIVAAVIVFELGRQSVTNTNESSAPALPIVVPELPPLTPPTQPVSSPASQMVGGDKDPQGCIGSAGYSWCQSKSRCLRVWEEGCPAADDSPLIKAALFAKNNWSKSLDVTVKVNTNDGKYASGTVNSREGGGGLFFATKVNGEWQIVADGNGVISCSSLAGYPDYPKTLIPVCYDQKTDKLVER